MHAQKKADTDIPLFGCNCHVYRSFCEFWVHSKQYLIREKIVNNLKFMSWELLQLQLRMLKTIDFLLKKWLFNYSRYSGYFWSEHIRNVLVWKFVGISSTKIIKTGSFLTELFQKKIRWRFGPRFTKNRQHKKNKNNVNAKCEHT